jgi:hypothetical protein
MPVRKRADFRAEGSFSQDKTVASKVARNSL